MGSLDMAMLWLAVKWAPHMRLHAHAPQVDSLRSQLEAMQEDNDEALQCYKYQVGAAGVLVVLHCGHNFT